MCHLVTRSEHNHSRLRMRGRITSRGSLRWSTRHLHHWWSPLRVEWRGSRRYFIKDWPPCLRTSGIKHIVLHFAGSAAGFHFPSCARLFNVSAVLAPVVAVPSNLHSLSTWSMLRHSFVCFDYSVIHTTKLFMYAVLVMLVTREKALFWYFCLALSFILVLFFFFTRKLAM